MADVLEFTVDEGRRRSIASHRVTASAWGKAGIVTTAVLLVATFVVPAYVGYAFADIQLTEDWPADGIAFAFLVFAILTIAAGAATWRQSTAGVTVRTNERLMARNGMLDYSFHASADEFPRSLNAVKVNLENTLVAYDERASRYVFNGGIRWHYYYDMADERLLAYEEMEPTESYEIGAYFGSAFDDFIRQYVTRSR